MFILELITCTMRRSTDKYFSLKHSTSILTTTLRVLRMMLLWWSCQLELWRSTLTTSDPPVFLPWASEQSKIWRTHLSTLLAGARLRMEPPSPRSSTNWKWRLSPTRSAWTATETSSSQLTSVLKASTEQELVRCEIVLKSNNSQILLVQGDSGSSLQSYDSSTGRWIQYGVVSFGASTGCGTGYPNGKIRQIISSNK